MQYIKFTDQEGYIALISVIILSAIVSVLALGHGLLVWNSRVEATNTQAKKQSLLLAAGCVRVAAVQLKNGWAIPSEGLVLPIQNQGCTIMQVTQQGAGWQVHTAASVRGAESHLLASIDGASFAVTMESEPP